MRIGSLCSGYGGLDLAVEQHFNATTAWHVEYEAAPSRILAAHWSAPNYGDVTTTDWSTVEPVEIITAGYPCQPFSVAGKRKGTDDNRHLWPGVAHAISVLRPRLVVLENVRGHVSLGFDAVLGDLAELGYDARWGVVRASDAGAPHGRARLFIIATDTRGEVSQLGPGLRASKPEGLGWGRPDHDGPQAPTAHANGLGLPRRTPSGRVPEQPWNPGGCDAPADFSWGAYGPAIARWESITRPAPRPTQPGRTAERLSPAFVEWMMGLPAGWVTDVGLTRTQQLKALGNGVVPQQARLALQLLDSLRPAA